MAEPHKTVRVQPREGYVVRDPVSGLPLSAAGEEKPRSSYWLRRLADGDVIEVQSDVPRAVAAMKPRKE